ncbi:unnamed protein product [Litomosoides sigmodontis]|uniref:Uncharacterized protein n=1 Tax=Litomosoides sigmodontis TaxID=42156 RepID=A0A3P6SPM5_LITSI|nr:unnamed protein product [Litomosoides sigmodontis]
MSEAFCAYQPCLLACVIIESVRHKFTLQQRLNAPSLNVPSPHLISSKLCFVDKQNKRPGKSIVHKNWIGAVSILILLIIRFIFPDVILMKLTGLLRFPVVRNSKGIALWQESDRIKFPKGKSERRFVWHKSPAVYALIFTLYFLYSRIRSETDQNYRPIWMPLNASQEEAQVLPDRSQLTRSKHW